MPLYALTQASLMVNSDTYKPHLKPILNEELTPERYSFKLCKFMQKQPLQHFVFYIPQYFCTAVVAKEHEKAQPCSSTHYSWPSLIFSLHLFPH